MLWAIAATLNFRNFPLITCSYAFGGVIAHRQSLEFCAIARSLTLTGKAILVIMYSKS
jgi:hypothetical protein